MSDEPDDGIVLQTITITRRINGESIAYSVDYTGDVGWLEGLGLLEAAKFDLYERCRGDWDGDETR